MIQFFYHPSPNPGKEVLFLEKSALRYEGIPVDTRKGKQFEPAFVAIDPNGKAPAITDGDVRVFGSNTILPYPAAKTGQFLPENTPKARALPFILEDDPWNDFPHLKRWFHVINARPIRANTLKDKHMFKTDLDAQVRCHMFRHVSPA